jgi:hypothetical protein
VVRAGEFLASARTHQVAGLPPSVMAREPAGARRQVGPLLTLTGDYGEPWPFVLCRGMNVPGCRGARPWVIAGRAVAVFGVADARG